MANVSAVVALKFILSPSNDPYAETLSVPLIPLMVPDPNSVPSDWLSVKAIILF